MAFAAFSASAQTPPSSGAGAPPVAEHRMQQRHAKHLAEHAAMSAKRADAVRTFYAALTPKQHKTFDTESLRHGKRAGHGSDGARSHGSPACNRTSLSIAKALCCQSCSSRLSHKFILPELLDAMQILGADNVFFTGSVRHARPPCAHAQSCSFSYSLLALRHSARDTFFGGKVSSSSHIVWF